MSEPATRSYVVTGGGRGIGRAVVERLLRGGDAVVAIELDPAALAWTAEHPAAARVRGVVGDAGDEAVTERAANQAQAAGTLAGWVNNAAVFRDASLHGGPTVRCSSSSPRTSSRRWSAAPPRCTASWPPAAAQRSSTSPPTRARRAVRGGLPHATAKAAVEGLTWALAVEYGPHGIRVNAVALGSITTERYAALLGGSEPAKAARMASEMAALHPLGRVGRPEEVAAAIAHLLSDEASFISGATVPVDGGRAALGLDHEAHDALAGG